MISCKELVDFFLAWSEGTLPKAVEEEFRKHLVACPPCEDYLKHYEQVAKLGPRMCDEAKKKAEPVPEALIQAILAARAKDPRCQGEGSKDPRGQADGPREA